MKKLIILTALMATVSILTYADNLENIKFKSEYGTGNLDDSSKRYSQFVNELSGSISLDDEWKGLIFNFDITRRDFLDSNNEPGGNTWDTDFNFMKAYKLGEKDLDFVFGFKYGNSNNLAVTYLDGLVPLKQLNGHGYEAYLGTVIPFTLFGQHGGLTPRVVYYNDEGFYTRDYKNDGTAGWGGDFDIAVGGPIVTGKYGGIVYGLSLNNHWRKATDTKKNELSDGKNSVYLNYIAILTYNSPRFYGFGFDLNVFNQWEKLTGDNQRKNGFYVAPKLLNSHTFDTSIGKLTINPYVSYNVVDEQDRHLNYLNKEFDYAGNKELTGGIEFSLDRR